MTLMRRMSQVRESVPCDRWVHQHGDHTSWLLGTECLCPPAHPTPGNSLCWSPNSQCDDIRRGDLGKVDHVMKAEPS